MRRDLLLVRSMVLSIHSQPGLNWAALLLRGWLLTSKGLFLVLSLHRQKRTAVAVIPVGVDGESRTLIIAIFVIVDTILIFSEALKPEGILALFI